ncbi:MAG TPA: cell wall hydrolase, partial [Oceanospirillaceae bacterium]|nr:cell wall hydrolase [Oceanospirillaceae bacterium]
MNLNARDILAKTLEAEAGNQGAIGMLSVGSVIMNRMMNPNYANNLHDVILQPGQFSVWNKTTGYAGGEQGVDVANMQASETAYAITDQLLDQN